MITVVGKGEARGFLSRLTAPLTTEAILKRLPINTRTSPAMGHVSVLVGIRRGVEKSVSVVEAGVIGYWPRSDALTIYPVDRKLYSPVNKIGEVTENLDLFLGLRSTSRIRIELV